MKRISLLASLFILLFVGKITSQDRFDAIRLSQNFYEGTARFTAMGGAFAALGGDPTTLSINPAGIGVYRAWEFSMTPAVSYSSTESSYYGTGKTSDSRTRFGFSNLGVITPFHEGKKVGINVGINYSKLNNFNSKASTLGYNMGEGSSMVHSFVNQANAIGYHWQDLDASRPFNNNAFGPGDWPIIQAWQTTLLADVTDYTYEPYVALGNHAKYSQTESEGSTGEYAFSIGGNVSHKFYFGATFGIQDVNYQSGRYYREDMASPTDLASFRYNQFYDTDGIGYNFKAGIIYRPIPELRLAFAAHTPTFFFLTDEYSSYMQTNIIGEGYYESLSPVNYYDYRVHTPYKLIAGLAYTFKNYGLISVDYEFIDYSTIRMKEDNDDYYWSGNPFHDENQIIKHTLRAASNFRVGAEGNLPFGFALRAGYGYYGSPYKSNAKNDGNYVVEGGDLIVPSYSMGIGDNTTNVYSFGVGYRFKYGYLDFAYSQTQSKVNYFLDSYTFGKMADVKTKTNFNRFALTFGLKF